MFIDYLKIASSISFYEKLGFKRVEAPWWVPKEIMQITKPKDSPEGSEYFLPKNNKCLVASAEQSFLYMYNQGLIPTGKFQATTPCFREEIQGPMKRKYFIKNELIITDNVNYDNLSLIIENSLSFFKTQVPNKKLLKVIKIEDTFDIEYDGIELGSYGIRSTHFLDWIYGTGCAEPRLTRAIQRSEFLKRKKSE